MRSVGALALRSMPAHTPMPSLPPNGPCPAPHLARRMRSVGALALRSMRMKRMVSEELMSELAAVLSVHSVSK